MVTKVGDNFDNYLEGFSDPDQLFGLGGDDVLEGHEGADLLDGGEGIDTVVYETSEFGVIVSFVDTKTEKGGDAEGDSLIGIENLIGSSHADFMIGDGNANRFEGRDGIDTLLGGGGADTLIGGLGDDDLAGDSGDDLLIGGFGADDLFGGSGVDTADYFDSDVAVFVDLTQNLAAFGDAGGDTFDSVENLVGSNFFDTLVGDGGANRLFGSLGNDTLDGRGGGDTLLGGFGDDRMFGGDGADFLSGGDGKDAMIGGAGNDTYVVSESGDIVDEANGGSGIDTVQSGVSFSLLGSMVLGAVENVTLTSNVNVNATGNDLANVLRGNIGDNRLNGGNGSDTMIGGAGNDRYTVTSAGDIVDESTGSGIDEIVTTVSISLGGPQVKGTVENVILVGTANINAEGNAAANGLVGNGGVNVLNGGAGDDLMRGGGGEDFFVFSTALNAATNVDVIDEYNVAQDTIRLENAIFTGLGNGALAAGAFRIGAAAADASDRIVYNDDTGALSFDADGSGAKAAIRFATLDEGLAMTNMDFFVI